MRPAVYDGVTAHARQGAAANRFRYRTRMWLVDLDDLPALPRGLRWAAQFRAQDHVGDPDASLRSNIAAVFERDGVEVGDCRLLMLAHARGLGYVFNPISVHWALAPDGAVRGVVAEVHNTYGGRHAYPLRLDAGRAEVGKALYVSPFYAVDGAYTIRVSPPEDRISLAVTLHPGHGPDFVATLNARRTPSRGLAIDALRSAGASWRTAALIRFQGIKLWARGLKVAPRPTGHDRELLNVPAAAAGTERPRRKEVAL